MQEREARRCGCCVPWTKGGISPIFGNAPKKYASRYCQLKVGHGAVGTFFTSTGVIESPECWWCKETVQSVGHLYTRCRRWMKEGRKANQRARERENFMAGSGRKKVASRLASKRKKAVAPLLRFLETTGVGGREGAREMTKQMKICLGELRRGIAQNSQLLTAAR